MRTDLPRTLGLLAALLPLLAGCAGREAGTAADRAAAEPAGQAPADGDSGPPPEGQPAPAPTATEAGAQPAAAPAGNLLDPQPPDGKWLTDDEGRQYFIRQAVKKEGTYIRLADGQVRMVGGFTIVPEREDDAFFYYRFYKAADWVPVHQRSAPTPEQLAAAAATYKPEAGESDRVRLAPLGQGLPTEAQWRNGFDLADMNGDGHLDIVHGPPRKGPGPPHIFLGDGKGGFRRWREAQFPPLAYDYGDAAAGDLDGDGRPDIALGVHLRGLIALAGDGNGTFRDWGKGLDFQVPGRGGQAVGFSARAIELVDWNGDGRLDILALGEGPRLNLGQTPDSPPTPLSNEAFGTAVYLNQGDGSWARITGGGDLFGDAVAVADLDGDGRLDFATGSGNTGRKDVVNLGQPDGSWKTVEIPELRPGVLVRSLAAADFDGDGRTELAVGYNAAELGLWRMGVDLFEMQADGTWQRRTLAAEPGRAGVTALAAGDLDADGRLDLVALTGLGATWILTGDGKGSFERQKGAPPEYAGRCTGYHVELADLDGRPGAEIVAAFAGEQSSPLVEPKGLISSGPCPTEGGFQVWSAAAAP